MVTTLPTPAFDRKRDTDQEANEAGSNLEHLLEEIGNLVPLGEVLIEVESNRKSRFMRLSGETRKRA